MLNKVKEAVKRHGLLNDGQRVVVGFSGGADSCSLLLSLKKLGYSVYALHVHHMIRGAEADRDLDFCRELCEKLDIELFIEYVDIPTLAKENGLSLETAARLERHRLFNLYSERYSCPIAVAHNKNDQAETVLMHLFRGSSLNGLCGIKYKNRNIIRPLLDISRNEIEDFCKANSISFVSDSTNVDTDYTRNRIRNIIIPEAEKAYPKCIDEIKKCSERLTEYSEYISCEVEKYCKLYVTEKNGEIVLTIHSLPHILQCEIIRKVLCALNGNIVDIEATHIESIYKLTQKQSGKVIQLPFSISVRREYDTLIFSKQGKIEEPPLLEFTTGVEYKWYNTTVNSCFVDEASHGTSFECLDFDKIPKNAVLRTRKSGDFIKKLNSNATCTLKKYFIDKKVPASQRDTIPLLAQDNEILAIIGYTVSERVKVTNTTDTIIKIFIGEKL